MTAPSPTRKLFIKTWGCQMNVYDSGRMADVLAPLGYAMTDEVKDADLVLFNTCHIREKASEKLFSELGRVREYQKEKEARGGRMMLGVAGCVAQAEGAEILRRAPYVDLVFGPQTYHQLPEMVGKAMRLAGGGVVNTEFPAESKFDFLPEEQGVSGKSAFLSVQEGCDKFCSYCVVPYTRGAEVSRPVQPILDEAKRLVAQGVCEITLLGQNVNAFHGESPEGHGKTWGLGRLIREMAEIDGLARIRYTTSHPRDMEDELIEAHRDVGKLMPYLHLPVQSGSDAILAAMNRKHTRDVYFRMVDKLRSVKPDLALSGDFIVGFPGERDKDFEDTLELIERVGYASAFSFAFSARPGTPASGLPNQIEDAVKKERLARLQDLLFRQQKHFNMGKVGQTMAVLFERKGKKDGQVMGKSPFLQSVLVEGDDSLLGQILDVTISQAYTNALMGEVCPSDRSF